MKNIVVAAAITTLLCFSAFAQSPSDAAALTSNPVFQKNCARCHGETAEGRHFHGPSLKSGKVAKLSADDLHKIVIKGKGHMPKFAGKLTPEEIDALVQQIQAANK